MASKFKVGDRVRIKPRIGRDDEYPIGYTQQMCTHVGEYREISAVINAEKCEKYVFGKKYYEEPYLYQIDGLTYFWSSAMLELVESNSQDVKPQRSNTPIIKVPCFKCNKTDYEDKLKKALVDLGCDVDGINNNWRNYPILYVDFCNSKVEAYNMAKLTFTSSMMDYGKKSRFSLCYSIDDFLTKVEEFIKIDKESTTLKDNKIMAKTNENTNSIFSNIINKYKSMFVPVEDNNVKLTIDGNMAVHIGDSYIAINDEDQLISYPEAMCLDVPIWVMTKPYAQVKEGDIIKTNGRYSKVLRKNVNDNTIRCISFNGTSQTKREIKDFIFKQSFVSVVVNMFDNVQSNGFNPMMLMLANGKTDLSDIMMMQMMGGKTFANNMPNNNEMNPLLMMALLDKKGDNNNNSMIEYMLMSQMFGNMFSKPTETKATDANLAPFPTSTDIPNEPIVTEEVN